MSLGSKKHLGLVLLVLTGGLAMGSAAEPARSRGATVNISTPKSDAVSTNLNDLRRPVSPFESLESTLKSPFEGAGKPNTGPDFREQRKLIKHNQTLNRTTLKDSLNKRAEQMFLNPELFEGDNGDEAFFQLSKDSLDPYAQKPKTSLDRYNDFQARDRKALTNAAAGKNPFDAKNLGRLDNPTSDGKNTKPFQGGILAGEERRDPFGLSPRAITNSSALSADRSPSVRSDMFNRTIEDPVVRRRPDAEVRMDNFKRLLEGSRHTAPATTARSSATGAPASYGSAPADNSRAAARTAAPPEWSAFRSTTRVETKEDFGKSAGLVGNLEKPQSLPEFPAATKSLSAAPSLPEPEPISAKKVQRPTFKIPQRRL